MPALDVLFSTVEKYDNMNIQYLSVGFVQFACPPSFFFHSLGGPVFAVLARLRVRCHYVERSRLFGYAVPLILYHSVK